MTPTILVTTRGQIRNSEFVFNWFWRCRFMFVITTNSFQSTLEEIRTSGLYREERVLNSPDMG